MSNLGQMALFCRSYGPSKFCKLALENGLCSDDPGMIGQKFLQHLFSLSSQQNCITLALRAPYGRRPVRISSRAHAGLTGLTTFFSCFFGQDKLIIRTIR